MRQVPEIPNYLLIGGGRLACHLGRYFEGLSIDFIQWTRESGSTAELIRSLKSQSHILLCIKDDSIESFFREFGQKEKTFVHFSGSLTIEGVYGFHPLMSFGHEHYSLETYKEIHFTGVEEPQTFRQCFPAFPNQYTQLDQNQMAFYHSLCVLGGNGTTLLWDLVGKEFEKLGLPASAISPYLNQVTHNIVTDQPGRWSGPWYRNDQLTIGRNKEALREGLLEDLYSEFEKLSTSSGHHHEKRTGI